MRLSELVGAAGSNAALRRTLSEIENWMTQVENQTGFLPSTVQAGKLGVPPLASLEIVGSNGQFTAKITNPVSVTGTLLHELKSSTTLPIIASSDLQTHLGGVPDTSVVIDLPNVSRYFQLRSRYQTSGFNNPQVFGLITSGQASSFSTSLLNIAYKLHTDPAAPMLIQPDVAAVIRVLPVILQAGTDHTLVYAGYPTVVDLAVDDQGVGLTFGDYFVYADDSAKAGGVVVLKATNDSGVLAKNDARFSLGKITLASNGGGLLFPDDEAGGAAAGTPIAVVDASGAVFYANIENLVSGQKIRGADSNNPDVLQAAPVAILNVPCFTITLQATNSVTLSADSGVQSGNGGVVNVRDVNIGDTINSDLGQQTVIAKDFAGLKTVYNLALSRNKLFLGNAIWCAQG